MTKIFSENGFIKLLSLALAVLLWLFVSNDTGDVSVREVSKTYDNIQPSIRNQDPELILVQEPQPVSATIRGTRPMLDQVQKDELMFYVDLQDLGPGAHSVSVLSSIPQFEVTEIHPREVEVELDEVTEQIFPVEPEIIGQPDEGLSPKKTIITPENVTVSGAKSLVEEIDRVVASLNINEAKESLEKGIAVEILNDENEIIEDVEVSPGMVEVSVPMEFPQKEVDVNVNIEDDLSGYNLENVEVSPEVVTVGGWESVLNELNYIETEPVQLTKLLEEETVVISLKQIEGVKELSESKVVVTGELDELEEVSFDVPLELSDDMTSDKITQDYVEVVVMGNPQALENLDKQDVKAYALKESLNDETSELEITVDLPSDVELLEINPSKVIYDQKD
ncbi:YbbR-like domain-containing protein [Natranaerobius trueperi]|uniref:YbbR domain-containing protein n=1 Tax=Natranaerobius trueperi TaxID=759412 RepID=A0A226C207_9FIRM|nr:CdaR family protein [Natranaerobius trueperi]OWZ84447.1 hypothetical protein CDO51_02780 [Natranaerobius trueperi]